MKIVAKNSRSEIVKMQAPLTFRVAINGFEKRADNHTWFTLMITSVEPGLPSKHYQIARTFKQFVQFSQQLRDDHSNYIESIPHLRPAKHFLSISLMTPNQKFEELERYLAQFSRLPTELVANLTSRNFFGIHEPDLGLNNSRMSTEVYPSAPPPLIRSTSDSSTNTQSSIVTEKTSTPDAKENQEKAMNGFFPSTDFASNMKRSRSLSVRPFLNNARSALTRQHSTNRSLIRTSSNSSIEDQAPTAPWNRPNETEEEHSFLFGIDAKLPTGVIAPWNLKNLDSKDQAILELLKPIVPKRRSRMQLGERANRMKDFENCMDTVLPADTVKFKVMLSQEQIIILRVSRTIEFSTLVLKIRAKFLRNSNSCAGQLKNKLLVYKLSSSKVYQLTDEDEFMELMAFKPEFVSLCWIDISQKFVSR